MAPDNSAQAPLHSPTGGAQGRSGSPSAQVNRNAGSHEASAYGCTRQASVVIHATIEHIGLVGETEMQVNVKWPASTFCAPPCERPASVAPTVNETGLPPNGPGAPNLSVLEVKAPSREDLVGESKPSSDETHPKNACGSNTEYAESDQSQSK
jgi:hypothetical protein